MADESKNGELQSNPFREDGPLAAPMAEVLHPELAADPEAAKHGARRFAARFSDAEIQKKLDLAASPGALWCASIHTVVPGDLGDDGRPILRHWIKHSDRLSHRDLASCAAGMAELVAKMIPLEQIGECIQQITKRVKAVFIERKSAAEVGIFGTVYEAPSTFGDEED